MQLSTRIAGLVVCLWLAGTAWVSAQFQKRETSMPSPNAASLGLYGEVPVSLYTGVPNVEIPLYTVQEGSIKVPISLSYHASGVRVNQRPGWVGLNWNLNAGGAITRKMRDIFDEATTRGYEEDTIQGRNWGYYYTGRYLRNAKWDSTTFITGLYTENAGTVITSSKLHTDNEPDEFSFNFLGYSGKFFLNENRQWIVQGSPGIQVRLMTNRLMDVGDDLRSNWLSWPLTSYMYSFRGFIITTPDGTNYEFGGTQADVEYEVPFFASGQTYPNTKNEGTEWMVNTWYLKRIVSPEGNEVTFNYEVPTKPNGRFIASFYRGFYNSYQSSSPNGSGIYCGDSQWSSGYDSTSATGGFLIRPTYLKEILFSTGKVQFNGDVTQELNYSPTILSGRMTGKKFPKTSTGSTPYYTYGSIAYLEDADETEFDNTCVGCQSQTDANIAVAKKILAKLKWRKLSSINVYSSSSGAPLVNKFEFDYLDNPQERLYLNGIKLQSRNADNCVNYYTFSYYKNASTPLPRYFDQKDQVDHWGFFNANKSFDIKDFNASNYQAFVDHKSPSADLAVRQEGTLSQIKYPTGGTSTFTYGKHDAYLTQRFLEDGGIDTVAYSGPVGGIRIERISNDDGSSVSNKDYVYTFRGQSSGILNGEVKYISALTMNAQLGGSSITYYQHVFSSQNTIPLSANSFGSHIGYRTVKEVTSSGGYKISHFTNYSSLDGAHLDVKIRPGQRTQQDGGMYALKNDLSLERGQLLAEITYSENNRKILERRINYARYNYKEARAIAADIVSVCNTFNAALKGLAYRNYAFQYQPSKETTITYDIEDDSRYKTDVAEYEYNGMGFLKQTRLTQNDRTRTTLNRYVADYPWANAIEDAGAISSMKAAGMNGLMIDQRILSNETPGGQNQLVDGYANKYGGFGAKANFMNYKPRKIYRYAGAPKSDLNFAESEMMTITNFDFGDGYNTRGEPQHFKDEKQVETLLEWYSNEKTGLLKKKTEGGKSTEYDYQPLVGVTKLTDANGRYSTYEYDGFNRLTAIKNQEGMLLNSYAYKVENSSGCSTPAFATENPCNLQPPSVTPASATYTGSPVTLQAGNCTGTYEWSTGATTSSIQVSPTQTTDYTVKCKSGSCEASATARVTVGPGGGSLVSGSCYKIKSRFTGQYLEALSSNTVERRAASAATTQIWKAESVGGSQYSFTVQDGTSRVISVLGDDNAWPITLSAYTGNSLQKWGLQDDGGGYFRPFTPSGVTWDIEGAGNGVILQLFGNKIEAAQSYRQFSFESASCSVTSGPACNGQSFTDGQLLGTYNGSNVYVRVIGSCLYVTVGSPSGNPVHNNWAMGVASTNGWANGITPLTTAQISECFKSENESCASTCSFTITTDANKTAVTGAPVTLSATCSGADCGGVTYLWSGTGITSNNTGLSVSFTAPSTVNTFTYQLTVKKPGCQDVVKNISVTTTSTGSGTACNGQSFTDGQLLGTYNGNNVYVRVIGSCLYVTVGSPSGNPVHNNWAMGVASTNGWANGITPLTTAQISECFKSENESCASTCSFTITTDANKTAVTGAPVTLSATCSGADCGGVTYLWTGTGITSNNTGLSVSFTAPSTVNTFTYQLTVKKPGCQDVVKNINVTTSAPSGTACNGQTFTDGQLLGTYMSNNVYVRVINGCFYVTKGDNPFGEPVNLDWARALNWEQGSWVSNVIPLTTNAQIEACFKEPGVPCTSGSCNFTITPGANQNVAAGARVQLTTSCSGADCAGVTYTWTGNGITGSGSSVIFSAPPTANTYTYRVTVKKSGCADVIKDLTVTTSGVTTTSCNGRTFADGQWLGTNANSSKDVYARIINGCLYITNEGPTGSAVFIDWLRGLNWTGGTWANGVQPMTEADITSCFKSINETCGGTSCNFTITPGANQSVVCGTSATLSTSCSGDCSGLTYSWSGNGVSGSASSVSFNASSTPGTSTYILKVNKTGCAEKTFTMTVTTSCGVNACDFMLTAVNATGPNNTIAAAPGSDILLETFCNGDCGNLSYAWDGQGGLSSKTVTAPLVPGSYTYTVTAGRAGCDSKQLSFNVVVWSTPPAGCYGIKGFQSEKYLQASAQGTQVKQYGANNQSNQVWEFTDAGSGQMRITSVSNNLSWDIAGAGTGDGTLLTMQPYGATSNQKFTISYVNDQYGGFRITPAHTTGSCVEMAGFSVADGGGAVLSTWNYDTGNRRWRLTPRTCPSGSTRVAQP